MRRNTLAGLAVSALTLLTASAALAVPPPECRSGNARQGYDEGYNLERNLLRYLWNTRFDCNTLEDFIYAVDVPLRTTPSTSRYLECRDVGIVEGIWEVIREKQTSCTWTCFDSGANIGAMQARTYCRLPMFYPKTETTAALPLCTITTEQACKATLRSQVNSMCRAQAASDPHYEAFVERACNFQSRP